MSKVIYKYPLQVNDAVFVLIPKGAELLCVQTQFNRPCLWALVDPDAESEEVRFRICGTGHPVKEENLQYIDTFQIEDGRLVFHVFKEL